jgi:hypothetical protein
MHRSWKIVISNNKRTELTAMKIKMKTGGYLRVAQLFVIGNDRNNDLDGITLQ